jgi:hypothetical protein
MIDIPSFSMESIQKDCAKDGDKDQNIMVLGIR